MNAGRTARAFRRARVVLCEGGGFVRPLLGISFSADGGLMLDVSRAPVGTFRYGVLDVPAGEGSLEAPVRPVEAAWAERVAPKLHYHSSGLLSLNATGHLARHGVVATPVSAVGLAHRHCFSLNARNPTQWPETAIRRTDLVFCTTPMPETITLAGFVGEIDNLHRDRLPSNPCGIMVERGDAVTPVVIAWAGEDARYYVWIELYADRPFGTGSDASFALTAFDPLECADLTSPTPMVALWSVQGIGEQGGGLATVTTP